MLSEYYTIKTLPKYKILQVLREINRIYICNIWKNYRLLNNSAYKEEWHLKKINK